MSVAYAIGVLLGLTTFLGVAVAAVTGRDRKSGIPLAAIYLVCFMIPGALSGTAIFTSSMWLDLLAFTLCYVALEFLMIRLGRMSARRRSGR